MVRFVTESKDQDGKSGSTAVGGNWEAVGEPSWWSIGQVWIHEGWWSPKYSRRNPEKEEASDGVGKEVERSGKLITLGWKHLWEYDQELNEIWIIHFL